MIRPPSTSSDSCLDEDVTHDRFDAFARKKTQEAAHAVIPPLRTIVDHSGDRPLQRIGNAWTRQHYDGDFHLFEPPSDLPAISLVFVQSRDGNTVIPDPAQLGGGPADFHLIFEGLARVAADAVLAGAKSVGKNRLFSTWHPELVSLRLGRGLPRHPAQIVISRSGNVRLDSLLFDVPDVPVFLVLGDEGRQRCEPALADRPWITIVPLSERGLPEAFRVLRRDHGVARISAIGGASTASALVDNGLVQDLCLTTTAHAGGTPDTPYYSGHLPPVLELIVRKQGMGESLPVTFEHFALRPV